MIVRGLSVLIRLCRFIYPWRKLLCRGKNTGCEEHIYLLALSVLTFKCFKNILSNYFSSKNGVLWDF